MVAGFYFVFAGGDPMQRRTRSFHSVCVCFFAPVFMPLPPLPGKYFHSPPLCGVTVLGCGLAAGILAGAP